MRHGNPAGNHGNGALLRHQFLRLLERHLVAQGRILRENRLLVGAGRLRVVDRDAVQDAREFLAHLPEPHLRKFRRQLVSEVNALVEKLLCEHRIEVTVGLVRLDFAFEPFLFGDERRPIVVERQHVSDRTRTHLVGKILAAGLADQAHGLLRLIQLALRRRHGRTARRREVKVHDAERTQLLQRRLLV